MAEVTWGPKVTAHQGCHIAQNVSDQTPAPESMGSNPLLSDHSWASYLISLCLSFLISKMESLIVPNSQGFCEN